ncbi:MAG TPA: hypothetical protein VFH68_01425 [Polyangia bacterium]|nr:hypothetical protein [Polyangia bacterium]
MSFFSSGSSAGSPLSFDVNPALSGTWQLNATATRRLNTPDGLFFVTRSATAMNSADFVTVNVPSGGSAVAPLTFQPGVVAGNFLQDTRGWGGPSSRSNTLPTYEGATSAKGWVGAGWTPSLIVQPPMRFTERYELNLDPRGTAWVLRAADGLSYSYSFPTATPDGSATSNFDRLSTMPIRNSGAPFVQPQTGNFAVLIGNVTAGTTLSVDLPAADFRIATVTLNPPANGISISWSAAHGQYPLTNGVLDVSSASSSSFSFDGSAVVGHAKLPPGSYNGTTSGADSSFNSFTETRRLDLQPDDDLTADFGAPMLLNVRPIPGAAGGSVTVTGTVVSSTPTVTPLQVLVNGASATVSANGSFSRATTIGTGPLTVVARNSQGRTTTLKRYFTTMAGLFAPAAGADLVSQGQDVNSIQNSLFLAPMSSTHFTHGQTIPLKLTGALGSVAVTNANAGTAPRIAAVLQLAPPTAPTIVHPTGGETVFRFVSGQWTCNFSTTGLSAGTYVVQIQFWDGRILEAAFVLA